jgi:peptidoglycan-N-acetylglucosamine deacetylase
VPSNRPVVYLTFDDGPEPTKTPGLLAVLANHGVHATFFLVGDHIGDAPEIAVQTLAEGHAIGNHSWSHPDLRTLTDSQILQQMNDTSAAILQATGHQVTCMRPPYGYVDPSSGPNVSPMNTNVRNVINSTGLTIEMWSHDTKDWEVTASTSSITAVLNSMPTAPGSSSTVLMHDWTPFTTIAVDQWLAANAGNFEFRTLPNC